MPELNPAPWLQNSGATNTAQLMRLGVGSLGAGRTGSGLNPRGGVHPNLGGSLAVTAGAGLSVDVASGVIFLPGTSDTVAQGCYVCANTSTVNRALQAADGSNDRIDLVVARIRDSFYDAGPDEDWIVDVVTGTPAGTPVPPTPTFENFQALAEVSVPALATSPGTITDRRLFAAAVGGIVPVQDSGGLPANPHVGMYADQADEEALKRWDGSAWGTVGSPQGYQFGGRVIYTSSGSFSKGNFPGLRAIDITAVGGGGGSGGVGACGAAEAAEAGGGAGGSGAKKFIDDMSLLAGTQSVAIGAGGNGASTGNNPGSAGGTSVFTISGTVDVVAPGGGGGAGMGASTTAVAAGGSAGAPGSGGDINLQGSTGGNGVVRTGAAGSGESNRVNFGGPAAFGLGPAVLTFGASSTGEDGHNYGGGASGPRNNDGDSSQAGQAGQSGIIIVELYF